MTNVRGVDLNEFYQITDECPNLTTFRSPLADIIYGTAKRQIIVSTTMDDNNVETKPFFEELREKLSETTCHIIAAANTGWITYHNSVAEGTPFNLVTEEDIKSESRKVSDNFLLDSFMLTRNKEEFSPITGDNYELKVMPMKSRKPPRGNKKEVVSKPPLRLSKLSLAMLVAQPVIK